MCYEDLVFRLTCDDCPEQYEVYDKTGMLVGYIRVRWGICCAWCIKDDVEHEVYATEDISGWWNFGNEPERRKHLKKITSAMVEWWNSST